MKLMSVALALVLLLFTVSFYTLFERKVLGSGHLRQGPVFVSGYGLLQPFSDAVKLLSKIFNGLSEANWLGYYIVPLFMLMVSMMFVTFFPWGGEVFSEAYYLLVLWSLSSAGAYSLIFMGFTSNSKYGSLGSLRGLAQTLSYEVCLVFAFVVISLPIGTYSWKMCFNSQSSLSWVMALAPMGFLMLLLLVSETNRAPFDFAEGESELVSGFNVEYASWSFVMIFLSEYLMVVIMSLLMVFLFVDSLVVSLSGLCSFTVLLLSFLLIRGVLPRYRYDKLMHLFWLVSLPSLLAGLALGSWF